MTTNLRRAASYGESVFRGLTGPLWRHRCGNVTTVDLLDDPRQPWETECAGCRDRDRENWLPLMVWTGPLCDQCEGNGWVPIAGKADGAVCGYETVTECAACDALGVVAGG